jgi:hypothetical protein
MAADVACIVPTWTSAHPRQLDRLHTYLRLIEHTAEVCHSAPWRVVAVRRTYFQVRHDWELLHQGYPSRPEDRPYPRHQFRATALNARTATKRPAPRAVCFTAGNAMAPAARSWSPYRPWPTRPGGSSGTCRWTPPWPERTSTPPVRVKGGSTEGTTRWDGPLRAGRSRPGSFPWQVDLQLCTWAVSRAASRWGSSSLLGSMATARSSPRYWSTPACPDQGRVVPGPGRIGYWPTRRTAPTPNVAICAGAGSRRPSRRRMTRRPTGARRGQGWPATEVRLDSQLYKQRHAVEHGISQLKQHRAAATRFAKLAVRYEATVRVASINIWLRCLERRI